MENNKMLLKKNLVSVVLFVPNLYIEANSFIVYKFFKAIGSLRTKLDEEKTGIVLIKEKKEKKVILLKGQNNLLDYSKKIIRSKIFKSFIKIAPVVIPVILVIVICVPGVYADGRNSQDSDLPPYHFDGQPIEQMQPIQPNSKLFHSITNKFGRWLVVSCGILNVAEYGVRISRACKEGDYLGAGYYTGQIFLNGCSLAAGELSRKSLTPEDRTLFQGLQTVSLALSSTLRFYD